MASDSFESERKSDFERLVARLNDHQVEFVVVGGRAEALHGSPRVTYDVDLCYRRSRENLSRLAECLRGLKPRLRGAPPEVPFTADRRTLELGGSFTMTTDLGDLDLLAEIEPIGDFEHVLAQSDLITLDDLPVRVLGLEALIRVKQHLGRTKDLEALRHLLAIRRLLDSREGTADPRPDLPGPSVG